MKETKKNKETIFAKRGFFVTLVVIVSLMIITVAMNLILPAEKPKNEPDQEAWRKAVEHAVKSRDDGLNSVYQEPAQAAASTAVPTQTTEPESSAETDDGSSGGNTETKSDGNTNESDGTPMHPSKPQLLKPVPGALSKDFSSEDLQYSETMEDWRVHEGLDFAADEGTEVIAAADGVVETVTEDSMLGTTVILLHPDGMRTLYANLLAGDCAAEGTQVKAGDAIGKVGKTAALEIIDPPHLHFEVILNQESQNPHPYLSDGVANDE